MILAPSAAFVSRTLNVTRDTEERSQATQLLGGQVDMLRYAMSTAAADTYLAPTSPNVFCVNVADASAGPIGLSGTNSSSLMPLKTDVLTSANYPTACSNGRYHFAVEKPTGSSQTYTFHARWDGINNIREEVIFYYRLYKEVGITGSPAIATPAPPPATCPLASPVSYTFDPGGPKANFTSNNNRISGPAGIQPQRLGPFNLSLPAGGIPAYDDYTVTLASYDTHDLGDSDAANPQERWHVILRDSSGNTTYTSPNSADVPATIVGGVRQGPPSVFTGQSIGAGSVRIVAEHIGINDNGFHVETATISCP